MYCQLYVVLNMCLPIPISSNHHTDTDKIPNSHPLILTIAMLKLVFKRYTYHNEGVCCCLRKKSWKLSSWQVERVNKDGGSSYLYYIFEAALQLALWKFRIV